MDIAVKLLLLIYLVLVIQHGITAASLRNRQPKKQNITDVDKSVTRKEIVETFTTNITNKEFNSLQSLNTTTSLTSNNKTSSERINLSIKLLNVSRFHFINELLTQSTLLGKKMTKIIPVTTTDEWNNVSPGNVTIVLMNSNNSATTTEVMTNKQVNDTTSKLLTMLQNGTATTSHLGDVTTIIHNTTIDREELKKPDESNINITNIHNNTTHATPTSLKVKKNEEVQIDLTTNSDDKHINKNENSSSSLNIEIVDLQTRTPEQQRTTPKTHQEIKNINEQLDTTKQPPKSPETHQRNINIHEQPDLSDSLSTASKSHQENKKSDLQPNTSEQPRTTFTNIENKEGIAWKEIHPKEETEEKTRTTLERKKNMKKIHVKNGMKLCGQQFVDTYKALCRSLDFKRINRGKRSLQEYVKSSKVIQDQQTALTFLKARRRRSDFMIHAQEECCMEGCTYKEVAEYCLI